MKRVEEEVEGRGEKVTNLRLRIGALSDVDPAWLRRDLREQAAERWGYVPDIVLEPSDDPDGADALGVTLVSIRVER